MATSIHAPQKETTGVPKTVQLCLQLDLASQRCLVTDCSISTATSALAPLTSNSGKKRGLNTALIDVIWMTQNHKILMFFFSPLKRKIESPRRRHSNFHSWVTRLPIEINVHVVHIFWRLLQIPAFSLFPSKMTISNSSPLQGRRVNRLPCFILFSGSILIYQRAYDGNPCFFDHPRLIIQVFLHCVESAFRSSDSRAKRVRRCAATAWHS